MELKHHGIIGMKWGVRKKVSSGSRVRKASQTQPQRINQPPKPPQASQSVQTKAPVQYNDYQKARELKFKGLESLSTEELRTLTNRLQLERQYNDLNPSSFDKAMAKTNKIISTVETANKAYKLLKSPLVQDIIKAMSKKAPASA